ncbi:type II toxin-antitoxin system RelE/ParE family toxin [Candidatus Uhrbacteria bacterium]|nr:type II toxin-antitoxin system RelE/ParE family toxin [Candidatus Uhrbacteria bacterium]
MNVVYSPEFKRALKRCGKTIKNKFYKQVGYLLNDLRHPSLRAKKYNEGKDVWQARVDRDYRFYFLIENDTYILLDICAHPK